MWVLAKSVCLEPSNKLQIEEYPEVPESSSQLLKMIEYPVIPEQCSKELRPDGLVNIMVLMDQSVAKNVYPACGHKRAELAMAELASDPAEPRDDLRFVVMP